MSDDSHDLDDNLAFGSPGFNIGQRVVGGCEWKNLVHHWAYSAGLNERRDQAQLASAGFHE